MDLDGFALLESLKRPAELLAIEDKVFSSIGKQAGFPGCHTVDAPSPLLSGRPTGFVDDQISTWCWGFYIHSRPIQQDTWKILVHNLLRTFFESFLNQCLE